MPAAVAEHAAAVGAAAVAISSRIEAELTELDDDEAAAMREELGVGETGLDRVVRGAFGLLDLLAFFTAGEDKPAQSWHLRRGLTAWHAAGEIHSDIQRGFVRAEVIGWEALVDAGGYAAGARSRHAPARGPRLPDGGRRRDHSQVHAVAPLPVRMAGRRHPSCWSLSDSETIRAALLRRLGERGDRVAGAGDGERALALVEREGPTSCCSTTSCRASTAWRCSTGCAPTTSSRRCR